MTGLAANGEITVLAAKVRTAAAALVDLTSGGTELDEATRTILADSVRYVLARFDIAPEPAPAITFPAPAVMTADEAAAARAAWERHFDPAATPKSVVVGRFHDGSGASDWAYGPFAPDEAARWAAMLTGGNWHHMQWSAVRLVGWPEGGEQ